LLNFFIISSILICNMLTYERCELSREIFFCVQKESYCITSNILNNSKAIRRRKDLIAVLFYVTMIKALNNKVKFISSSATSTCWSWECDGKLRNNIISVLLTKRVERDWIDIKKNCQSEITGILQNNFNINAN